MGNLTGSLFSDTGGSIVVTDLEVDSGTLSIDETNNRFGYNYSAEMVLRC